MFKIRDEIIAVFLWAAVCAATASEPKSVDFERPKLELAKRDPFSALAPPLPKKIPKLSPQPLPAIITPAPIATPLPTAPELGLYYAGQMTTPTGERRVFAMQQDQLVMLKAGMTLSNGFVVRAIEPRIVHFHYPITNSTARLNLPELPTFQSR